eukprot:TRINITY_DN6042_c0_g1_i1.p1 TRINITY_DN6042_c0_g1~~TRINITY_DN6042_c0_g1_i1.p1  ORF type:complete len:137 (-),score=39.04 TRINITY_DN6042_c0_g1_i1:34-444(-)
MSSGAPLSSSSGVSSRNTTTLIPNAKLHGRSNEKTKIQGEDSNQIASLSPEPPTAAPFTPHDVNKKKSSSLKVTPQEYSRSLENDIAALDLVIARLEREKEYITKHAFSTHLTEDTPIMPSDAKNKLRSFFSTKQS